MKLVNQLLIFLNIVIFSFAELNLANFFDSQSEREFEILHRRIKCKNKSGEILLFDNNIENFLQDKNLISIIADEMKLTLRDKIRNSLIREIALKDIVLILDEIKSNSKKFPTMNCFEIHFKFKEQDFSLILCAKNLDDKFKWMSNLVKLKYCRSKYIEKNYFNEKKKRGK